MCALPASASPSRQFEVRADDFVVAQALLRDWCDQVKLDLVVVTGGTGLGPRDVAPEVMDSLLERRLSGVEEAMRAYGQERVPTAMLSRSRAGQRGRTLLLALPGSPKGRGGIAGCDFADGAACHSDDGG